MTDVQERGTHSVRHSSGWRQHEGLVPRPKNMQCAVYGRDEIVWIVDETGMARVTAGAH